MNNQSGKVKRKSKIEDLIENYPALGVVRYEWRWRENRSQKWRHPKMNIKIQMADPNAMHLQAKNIEYEDRSYVIGNNDLRGTRQEYMCAVNSDDRVIAILNWESGEHEKMSKDIFNIVNLESVCYLMWVQTIEWYDPASEQREKETGGILFGPDRKGVELNVYIFRRPKGKTFQELIEIADKEKKEREEAYLYFPKEQPAFPGIHKALREGDKMHAFSSGGGLRVVSFSNIGYGEHPHIEEALKHLEEDYLAGGRPYKKVYGKLYPHYLTGASTTTSNLDCWIRQGNTFDCWQEGDEIILKLCGYAEVHVPDEVSKKVKEILLKVEWEDVNRGFKYQVEPFVFANDTVGISSKVISGPKGKDPFSYKMTKTGRGQNFWDAVKKSFEAPEVEVIK